MAKLGSFRQSTIERKLYTVDYSDWLASGETISAVAYEVRKLPAETITVEASVDDDTTLGGTQVRFFFEDGVTGASYRVEVQVTTSATQVKEDYVVFQVVDP